MLSGKVTVSNMNSLQVILDTSIVIPEWAEGTVIRQKSRPATMDVTFVTIRTPAMEHCYGQH